MARLLRPKVEKVSKKTHLNELLEKRVCWLNSGILSAPMCTKFSEILAFGKGIKRGDLRVLSFNLFDTSGLEESATRTAPREYNVFQGRGVRIAKHLRKFTELRKYLQNKSGYFLVSASKYELEPKHRTLVSAKHSEAFNFQIDDYMTDVYRDGVSVADRRFVRVEEARGSFIVYRPTDKSEITREFRQELLAKEYHVSGSNLLHLPRFNFGDCADLWDAVEVEARDLNTDDTIKLDKCLIYTECYINPRGGEVRKVPRGANVHDYIMDEPFILIYEREGVEVFAAAINKHNWKQVE